MGWRDKVRAIGNGVAAADLRDMVRSVTGGDAAAPATPVPAEASWLQVPTVAIGKAVALAGESHYQAALAAVCGGRFYDGVRAPLVTATIVPETFEGAPAVRVEIAGSTVGYLPREEVGKYHAALTSLADSQGVATARARLTGGWDRGGGNVGAIGCEVLIGPKPKAWSSKSAFMPSGASHEVTLLADGARVVAAEMKARKSAKSVTLRLAESDNGSVAIAFGDAWIGHVLQGDGASKVLAVVRAVAEQGLPMTATGDFQRAESGFRVRVSAALPEREIDMASEKSRRELFVLRRQPPTGRWQCVACGHSWSRKGAAADWWRQHEGAHVCPECGSYAYTHPA